MTGYVVCLLVGYVAGAATMLPGGVAYARALRAYRDWRATVAALRGLRRRTFAQWWKAVRQVGVVMLVIAGMVVVLVVVARG